MLIINVARGRNGTVTVTAILDTQLKINLPPTLNVGTGGGSPVSAGTAANRDRNELGAGKGPPLTAGNKGRSQAECLPGSSWAPWHL